MVDTRTVPSSDANAFEQTAEAADGAPLRLARVTVAVAIARQVQPVCLALGPIPARAVRAAGTVDAKRPTGGAHLGATRKRAHRRMVRPRLRHR